MNSIIKELQDRGIETGVKIGFDKGQKSGFDKGQKYGAIKTESAYLMAMKSIGLTDQQIQDIQNKAKETLQL